MKPLLLLLIPLLLAGNAFAGSGSYCDPNDKHFQAEVKSELCMSEDKNYQIPRIKWVGVRGYEKNYPKCEDFGLVDFPQYDRDFWGNLKCGAPCQTLIDLLYIQHLKDMCGKDYKRR